MNSIKYKSLALILFPLISMYPYLSKQGWMAHIETREKITLYEFKDHKYDVLLQDLKVIIDSREFGEESYDETTKTLYLSPLILER